MEKIIKSASSDESPKITSFTIVLCSTMNNIIAKDDIRIEKLINLCKNGIGQMHNTTFATIFFDHKCNLTFTVETDRLMLRPLRAKFLRYMHDNLPEDWAIVI